MSKITAEQIVKDNIVKIDDTDFIVDISIDNRPFLTTVESYNLYKQQDISLASCHYTSPRYVSQHLRIKTKDNTIGAALFKSVEDLVECVNSKNYYIG